MQRRVRATAASVVGRPAVQKTPVAWLSQAPKAGTISQLSQFGGVHGKGSSQKVGSWRNRPLFRREGDVRFKNGAEARNLIMEEVRRRDPGQPLFQQSFETTLESLEHTFDRNPKYAFVAKQLVEPERLFHFRVAWLDDAGTLRMNRGFRCQYASTLGPYHGGLHFGPHVDLDLVKALAFDLVVSNSVSTSNVGAAVGGANFDPRNKSEAEIQRFCQSFMTELSKYIGPDLDLPSMGQGVGAVEMGYLYGQYKRLGMSLSRKSAGILWGGRPLWPEATGHGVVYFARRLLEAKGDTLEGKRCLITGSGTLALSVADKLLQLGAVPISFSDSSGFIFEERGLDSSKLSTIKQIKADRGARVGRYIMASTTASYLSPEEAFAMPCDLVFPCSHVNEVTAEVATMLADHGCKGVMESATMPTTPEAARILKQRGVLYAPSRATQAAGQIANGLEMDLNPISYEEDLDAKLQVAADSIYKKVCVRVPPGRLKRQAAMSECVTAVVEQRVTGASVAHPVLISVAWGQVANTAKEFNCKGDLQKGTNIAGFLKVANVMNLHGAV